MTGHITGHMGKASQRSAVARHRLRLRERGVSRYEVRGLDSDKDLVRSLARRLAKDDAAAAALRVDVADKIAAGTGKRGGILAALRRSPLVGAGLRVRREHSTGRDVDL